MTNEEPTTITPAAVHEVSPEELERWLEAGEAVLVDVREGFEHAAERIQGAVHESLSSLDVEAIRQRCGDARVVFHCRSGSRSRKAAERFGGESFHLAGGIESWKASGRSTVKAAGPTLDVMRQVQITAGSLVLLGVAFSFLTPWAIGLSAFVGAGLVFAGASGWCGMAKLLAVMPWNRPASIDGA